METGSLILGCVLMSTYVWLLVRSCKRRGFTRYLFLPEISMDWSPDFVYSLPPFSFF